MNRLCILGRRKFTNLPSIPVDGTKVRRVPYPKYAQYALIGGGISLIGLIGIGAYLDQQRPTHPYRDLIQDVCLRGTILSLSAIMVLPVLLILYRKRGYWVFRHKTSYLSALIGTAAFFQYSALFPNTTLADICAPLFGISFSIFASALMNPICLDGWVVSALFGASTTFVITWAVTQNYFDGILYERRAEKWQRELAEKLKNSED